MCHGCFPGELILARAVAPDLSSLAKALSSSTSTNATANVGPNVYFYNGAIITMANGSFSPVEALAISGSNGLITAAGSLDAVKSTAGSDATPFDLNGQCLLPGFVEPHMHLSLTALIGDTFVDLSPLKVTTKQQALDALKAKLPSVQSGSWLAGYGYDPSRVKPFGDDLLATDLDTVSDTVNIVVLNASGHLGYVNHCAFTTCGIDKNTPDPPGGSYQHDPKTGELTGVVVEQGAIGQFTSKLPTPDNLVQDCIDTLKSLSRVGCTTIFDAAIGILRPGTTDDWTLMSGLANMPGCPMRITGAMTQDLAQRLKLSGSRPPYVTGNLSVRSIKFWADGSTQGYTGAVRDPYLDDKGWGLLNWSDSDLRGYMAAWQTNKWQLLVHSNGDRATDQVLGAYDYILNHKPDPDPNMLHRIEHFTVTVPGQLVQAKRLNLGVTHLIGHVYYWGQAFRDHILGKSRAERIDPVAEDDKNGLIFSFHSDSPVTPVKPLLYVKTAVTRTLYQAEHEILGKDQRVNLETALRGVTINAAKQCMLGDVCGSLEVGKSADLVLLNKDPRQVASQDLDTLVVQGTWLAGQQIWSSK